MQVSSYFHKETKFESVLKAEIVPSEENLNKQIEKEFLISANFN